MTTAPLSPEQLERARNYQSLMLHQFAAIGQRAVANALDVSEATVSRMKGEQLESICRLLVALELQVVEGDAVMTCPKYLYSLRCIARRELDNEGLAP